MTRTIGKQKYAAMKKGKQFKLAFTLWGNYAKEI